MKLKGTLLLTFLCTIAMLHFNACRNKTKVKIQGNEREIDEESLKSCVQNYLNTLAKDSSYKHYYDTLMSHYQNRGFAPIWLEIYKDENSLKPLYNLLDSALYEGLRPEHYHKSSIQSLIKKISSNNNDSIHQFLALFDVYVSDALLSLWHDKVLGRTNPKQVLGSKYTLPYPCHPDFNLMKVLDPEKGISTLLNYHSYHKDYWNLKKLLAIEYSKTKGSETIIDTIGIRKIKPGDTTNIAPLVVRRLVELGIAPDSLLNETTTIYSKKIAKYIIKIQEQANLTNDGIIGKTTLKVLNTSSNDKINEIRANLERIRWFATEPTKPYVMVNLPEFMLYTVYNDSVKSMIVCIGKGKERYYDLKSKKYLETKKYLDKPQNNETPQVYSNIDYVVLNPTWTVPSSIVGREMFRRIVANPGYLSRNGYQVLLKGNVVDPYSIDWKKYSPGNIPYTIRQNAGDDNSLGKIKFTFKNPFDVYLHDTPLKSKFKLSNRAVSHGCVRVSSPIDLTGFVLQQNTKTTYDDVRIKMGIAPIDTAKARKWREDTTSYKKVVKGTYPIKLENKMTVFFDYKTIVFDEFGNPRFVFDVYDKNRLIVEAMDKF
jgi:murein L,D-transpeptidase YcbB/YkuD